MKYLNFLKFFLALSTVIVGVIYFPDLRYSNIVQGNLKVNALSVFVLLLSWIIILALPKKIPVLILGLIAIFSFVASMYFLFNEYFPYLEKNTIEVPDCSDKSDIRFIRGNVVRTDNFSEKMVNPDSVSSRSPREYIYMCDCDPTKGWAIESLHDVYNSIIYRFILINFLFGLFIFSFAEVLGRVKNSDLKIE